MTYFAPCFNCAADKATCERRATMRKALKGTGITSAKFNCPDRQAKRVCSVCQAVGDADHAGHCSESW